ncbi:MAG: TauD/TfdA family dioxygenase [Burkholderiales bacterium]|nr:TauD/TfdA family dioxygenase [Burkholderiales bacterium]
MSNTLHLPVFENEQAWRGPSMAKRSDWIHELTPQEIDDLDAAVQAVEQRGIDLVELRRGDFPLGPLAKTLAKLRHDLLHGRGFFMVRGVPVHRYSRLQSCIAFFGIGLHLGDPVSQNGKGHILGHVKNLGANFSDPEIRGYQTSARLAYHTDYSDVVGLLCLQTSRAGGASSIVSSTTLWNEVVHRRPDLAEALLKPLYYTRWGEIPAGKQRYSEVPPFSPWQGRMIAFLNTRMTIMKAQAFPEVPRLTAQQLEGLDLLDELENDPELHLDMMFQPGDMQFVCNHFILHSRTAYEDWPEPERRRHLLRLWLACPEGPQLPPFMADDFQGSTASGRPNGIHPPGVPFKAPLEAE